MIKHSGGRGNLRLVFSTFLSCSQMPVAFYHSVIHGLGFFTIRLRLLFNVATAINFVSVSFAGSSCSLWLLLAWISAPVLIYRQVVVHGLMVINSFRDLARLHDQAEDSMVEKQHRKAE